MEEIDLDALEETGTEAFETDRARVKAAAVDVDGRRYWIITGATFENRDEALAELRRVLWLSAPLALLLVGLAGYMAVGRALRPLAATLARLKQALASERKLVGRRQPRAADAAGHHLGRARARAGRRGER